MVKIRRLLRDYRHSGALHEQIGLWGFLDDHTFLTKAGAVGVAFRLTGVDDECLDHPERRQIVQRFERALRVLPESCRVYQYLLKSPAALPPAATHSHPVVRAALDARAASLAASADQLFTFGLYLVLLYEPPVSAQSTRHRVATLLRTPHATLRGAWSLANATHTLADDLDRSVAVLRQKAEAFAAQLADLLRPELLSKAEAFQVLRCLVNYAPHTREARLKHDTHLDVYVADATVDCHRAHLEMDGYRVKVLTMKEPPARTYAHILRDLARLPSPFVACLDWQRLAHATMRRDLHRRRRHFFNRRISLVNYVNPETRPDEMLVDDSATATVHELGQSLTAMDVDGHFFGACSLTLVLYDRDAQRLDGSVAEAIKTFAGHDGTWCEESYNLVNAWLAIVPGNGAHNLRRLPLLNTNAADLSFLFAPHGGAKPSDGGRAIAWLETEQQTLFPWTLSHEGVGHTLFLGATGSGKSFTLNFLIAAAQQVDPITVIFDLGGSYDTLTRRLGGSVWRMGLGPRAFTINPFCLEPSLDNRHFLVSFVRVLLQSGGQYRVTMPDDRDLHEAVENIYALDPPQRRLFTLATILPRPLAQHLARWVQGGPYASLFDHAEDTLTFQRVQCFDFEGLDQYPLLLEPLLFYVLHRASAAINASAAASAMKLFVLDEAWRFAQDGTLKAYITEALKTWRKRNAAMLLATQSSDDFAATDLLRTVIESCPTKVFLANPNLDVERARHLFHLNQTEAARITTLVPRRHLLFTRPGVSKVLTLHVDADTARLFTPAPGDRARSPHSSQEVLA